MLKCNVCGYKKGYDPESDREFNKNGKNFIEIQGIFQVFVNESAKRKEDIDLFACPECNSLIADFSKVNLNEIKQKEKTHIINRLNREAEIHFEPILKTYQKTDSIKRLKKLKAKLDIWLNEIYSEGDEPLVKDIEIKRETANYLAQKISEKIESLEEE